MRERAAIDHSPLARFWRLEVVGEGNFAFDGTLVGGDALLEEVGELLNVLQVHEGEGVFRVEGLRDAEALEALRSSGSGT
jgi:hypothetical protein